MISHISLLRKARVFCILLLGDNIIKDQLNENISQLKLNLKSGLILYIRYNEFNEYGYQIVYSPKKIDFARFNNFDDKWNVSTKPHHFSSKRK